MPNYRIIDWFENNAADKAAAEDYIQRMKDMGWEEDERWFEGEGQAKKGFCKLRL